MVLRGILCILYQIKGTGAILDIQGNTPSCLRPLYIEYFRDYDKKKIHISMYDIFVGGIFNAKNVSMQFYCFFGLIKKCGGVLG